MEICIGRMQMPLQQWWDSEIREIILAIKGWQTEKDERIRDKYERSRMIQFYMMRTAFKINKPTDLYFLPWETEGRPATVKVSKEEFKQITQRWDEEMMGPDGKFR